MKCSKCDSKLYKEDMCKSHYYKRSQAKRYLGHKNELNNPSKERKCLLCDQVFYSTGNRRCNECNSTSYSEYDSNISLFITT
jgi:hypothetical protein